MKRIDETHQYMPGPEERILVDELDREATRNGGLFALLACLAIAAGLVLSTILTMAAVPA